MSKKISPKRMFKIGDYVEASHIVQVNYLGKLGAQQMQRLLTPVARIVRGQIVGGGWRYEGSLVHYVGDPTEFQHKRAVFVWKIARSLTNTPVEALAEHIKILGPAGSDVFGEDLPLRLPGPAWTDINRDVLREEMADVPRDAKGRWLKVRCPTIPYL
jgi:hypothetical protein